jgi:DNA-directed RNA polymerase specialized sigma24 family protein
MTADAAAAVGAAKFWATVWGRPDWRPLLGAAWLGVRRADPAVRGGGMTAARWEILNATAADARGRLPDADPGADPPDHRGGDWLAGLVAAWGEYRPARRGLPVQARVWLYLWLVEGWSLNEIGAAWGVTRQAVSKQLRAARAEIARRRAEAGVGDE